MCVPILWKASPHEKIPLVQEKVHRYDGRFWLETLAKAETRSWLSAPLLQEHLSGCQCNYNFYVI